MTTSRKRAGAGSGSGLPVERSTSRSIPSIVSPASASRPRVSYQRGDSGTMRRITST